MLLRAESRSLIFVLCSLSYRELNTNAESSKNKVQRTKIISKAETSLSGENNGRTDSIVRCHNADSQTHRCFSRRPLCLPEWQTFSALLSNAVSLSLLRHCSRAGSRPK